MLANRMEAIDNERSRVGETRRPSEVARLALGPAPALGKGARSGEELARRIVRLASMAAVLHAAEAVSRQRQAEAGEASLDDAEVRS
ncbi:MAG: hypothetical protein IT430_05295 [Phycisphaerales bacterium]|nr:hypothetical protein [Phycisphaerales bacterium]